MNIEFKQKPPRTVMVGELDYGQWFITEKEPGDVFICIEDDGEIVNPQPVKVPAVRDDGEIFLFSTDEQVIPVDGKITIWEV